MACHLLTLYTVHCVIGPPRCTATTITGIMAAGQGWSYTLWQLRVLLDGGVVQTSPSRRYAAPTTGVSVTSTFPATYPYALIYVIADVQKEGRTTGWPSQVGTAHLWCVGMCHCVCDDGIVLCGIVCQLQPLARSPPLRSLSLHILVRTRVCRPLSPIITPY